MFPCFASLVSGVTAVRAPVGRSFEPTFPPRSRNGVDKVSLCGFAVFVTFRSRLANARGSYHVVTWLFALSLCGSRASGIRQGYMGWDV